MPYPGRGAGGGGARAWVLDHFDAEMAGQRMLALYGDLAGNPASHPPAAV